MRLEHYDPVVLKREILAIISRHLDIKKYRVFVFGSRVNGGGNERSDIDIGIEGEMSIPNSALGNIKEDVENLDTLYTIDVVDFAAVSDRFKAVALKHTEPLQ